MNILRVDSICIWSENPDQLASFYENILGLTVDQKLDLPDDKGISFNLNGVLVFIGYHNKVSGNAKDPYRIMPGFWVDSVKAVYEELSQKNIEFLRKPSISPDGTYYAATIRDPEENIIQFFSEKM